MFYGQYHIYIGYLFHYLWQIYSKLSEHFLWYIFYALDLLLNYFLHCLHGWWTVYFDEFVFLYIFFHYEKENFECLFWIFFIQLFKSLFFLISQSIVDSYITLCSFFGGVGCSITIFLFWQLFTSFSNHIYSMFHLHLSVKCVLFAYRISCL